jgi:hypothetical protein
MAENSFEQPCLRVDEAGNRMVIRYGAQKHGPLLVAKEMVRALSPYQIG